MAILILWYRRWCYILNSFQCKRWWSRVCLSICGIDMVIRADKEESHHCAVKEMTMIRRELGRSFEQVFIGREDHGVEVEQRILGERDMCQKLSHAREVTSSQSCGITAQVWSERRQGRGKEVTTDSKKPCWRTHRLFSTSWWSHRRMLWGRRTGPLCFSKMDAKNAQGD